MTQDTFLRTFVLQKRAVSDDLTLKTPPVLPHERGFEDFSQGRRQADHSGAVRWGAKAHGILLPSLRPDTQSAVLARLSLTIAGGVMLLRHPPGWRLRNPTRVAAATCRRSALTSGAASMKRFPPEVAAAQSTLRCQKKGMPRPGKRQGNGG